MSTFDFESLGPLMPHNIKLLRYDVDGRLRVSDYTQQKEYIKANRPPLWVLRGTEIATWLTPTESMAG